MFARREAAADLECGDRSPGLVAEHPGQASREGRRPYTGRCPSCAVLQEVQPSLHSLHTLLHSVDSLTGIVGHCEHHPAQANHHTNTLVLVLDSTGFGLF